MRNRHSHAPRTPGARRRAILDRIRRREDARTWSTSDAVQLHEMFALVTL
jgi:hypothetical protein